MDVWISLTLFLVFELAALCLPVALPRPDLELVLLLDFARRRPFAQGTGLAFGLALLAGAFEPVGPAAHFVLDLLVLWVAERVLQQLSVGRLGALLLTAAGSFLLSILLRHETGLASVLLNLLLLLALERWQPSLAPFRGRKYGWVAGSS